MGYDSNRGRDLPRGRQHVVQKGLKDEASGARQREIERAKRRTYLRSKLVEIEKWLNVGSLDLGGGTTRSDKQLDKDRRVIEEALLLELEVRSTLLEFYGYQAEPNPRVPDSLDPEIPI